MNDLLTKDIKNKIQFVASYIEDSTNDWFRIKKELINCLPIEERHNFSRRHKTSKKFFINDFDNSVINYWEQITGVVLFIDKTRLHKTEDERPPRYWALMEYNEKRKKTINK